MIGITLADGRYLDEDSILEMLDENRLMRERIGEVANEWAELGKIPNTPQAKRDWIEGRLRSTR